MTPAEHQSLLADAVERLNREDWSGVLRVLEPLLAAPPGSPVAQYLAGMAQARLGRLDEAERHLRAATAAGEAPPQVHVELARTLRRLGRHKEASAPYALALAAWPGEAGLELEWAQACEEGGDLTGAERGYRGLLGRGEAGLVAAAYLARLMNWSGRSGDAEAVAAQALSSGRASAPARALLAHALGLSLKLQRRHGEALTWFEEAAALAPADPAVLFGQATVLQHLRRFGDAVAVLEQLLARHPSNLEAHVQLNELYYRLGVDDRFLASYGEAAARVEHPAPLLVAKANALIKFGRLAEAEAALQGALEGSPDDAAVLIAMARLRETQGDRSAALAQCEQAVRRHPDDVDVLAESAAIRLRAGDPERARDQALRAHALRPADQGALAVLGLCHRALDDEREHWLNGYDQLVGVFDLDPPDGYTDMGAFNRDLAAYLDGLHGDKREYFTQTLRGGTRLYDEVFNNGHGLADRLRLRIDRAINQYVAGLKLEEGHPFARRSAGFAYVSSWSSRLSDRGFHVSHIHHQGWISAVYYVATPDCVQDSPDQQGWLTFGQPPTEFGDGFPPRRTVEPRPGRLVLFPSYLWHGTIPFHSAQDRMTIAFDVAPR